MTSGCTGVFSLGQIGFFAIGGLQTGPLYGFSQIILSVEFILVMIFRPPGLLGDRKLGFGMLAKPPFNDEPLGANLTVTPVRAAGLNAEPEDSRD